MAEQDELFGRTVGDYILFERIGEGGFAKVYRGEQPTLGSKVVIKVLRQHLRVRPVGAKRVIWHVGGAATPIGGVPSLPLAGGGSGDPPTAPPERSLTDPRPRRERTSSLLVVRRP